VTTYLEQSWAVIDAVHASLPLDVTDAERRKAISDSYPFGERAHWPYKSWLKAQRLYLARWSVTPAGPLDARPQPKEPTP